MSEKNAVEVVLEPEMFEKPCHDAQKKVIVLVIEDSRLVKRLSMVFSGEVGD